MERDRAMTGPLTPEGQDLLAFCKAIDPAQGQLLEARSFQLDQIARVMAVPAALVTNGREGHGRK